MPIASRPVHLDDFLFAFERNAWRLTGEDLERYWFQRSCPELIEAAESVRLDGFLVRRHIWTILNESVRRLQGAYRACMLLSGLLPDGIRAVLVTGSSARGEAVAESDIDFNVYVTESFARTELWTSRNLGAGTPRELLMQYEERLRRCRLVGTSEDLQGRLLTELQSLGLCRNESRLALKPFSRHDVDPSSERNRGIECEALLGPVHLSNIIFGATPMLGGEVFNSLLDATLSDAASFFLGLFGRVALLETAREEMAADDAPNRTKYLHNIAAGMAAVIAAGTLAEDPQAPYWWTLDLDQTRVIHGPERSAILQALALITTCRGGETRRADDTTTHVDSALRALPMAIDMVVERLTEEGADNKTLEAWRGVHALVADRAGSRLLAEEFGMIR